MALYAGGEARHGVDGRDMPGHDVVGSWLAKRLTVLMQYTMATALMATPLHRHPGIAGAARSLPAVDGGDPAMT